MQMPENEDIKRTHSNFRMNQFKSVDSELLAISTEDPIGNGQLIVVFPPSG